MKENKETMKERKNERKTDKKRRKIKNIRKVRTYFWYHNNGTK